MKNTLQEDAHQILIDFGILSLSETINVHSVEGLMVLMGELQLKKLYTEEDLKNAFEGGHISARQKASYKSNGTYYEDLNDWINEYKKQ